MGVFGEGNFEVYHSSYKPLEWTLSPDRGHESAFAKVLVLRSNDKVIGMHYCGPNAGEVIQGYGVAVKAGLTYKTLLDTVGIHPTVAEEFTQLTARVLENPLKNLVAEDRPFSSFEGKGVYWFLICLL